VATASRIRARDGGLPVLAWAGRATSGDSASDFSGGFLNVNGVNYGLLRFAHRQHAHGLGAYVNIAARINAFIRRYRPTFILFAAVPTFGYAGKTSGMGSTGIGLETSVDISDVIITSRMQGGRSWTIWWGSLHYTSFIATRKRESEAGSRLPEPVSRGPTILLAAR